jgi:hypothetical protein
MSEEERPSIEAEVVLLRAEASALRAENTALKVENAELKADKKWLVRGAWGLLIIALMLIAALVLVHMGRPAKERKKSSHTGSINLLFRLMKDLMEAEEVERFVRLHFGETGTAIVQSLSKPTSPDDLFLKVVLALKRQGLVTELFFEALIEFRPHQRDYILQIQGEYVASAADGDSPPAA